MQTTIIGLRPGHCKLRADIHRMGLTASANSIAYHTRLLRSCKKRANSLQQTMEEQCRPQVPGPVYDPHHNRHIANMATEEAHM